MQVATHIVSDSGSATGPSAAVAVQDGALGFTGVADASVAASMLERDLGHAASRLVLDTIRGHLAKHGELRGLLATAPDDERREKMLEVLRTAVNLASREVYALGRRRNVEIMVTVDLVVTAGAECFVAHVGDGRTYLLRKGLVHKLTQDHLGEEIVPPTAAPPGLMPTPRRATSRSLGPAVQVEAEALNVQVSDGDRLLLASPWLNRGLDDLKMREVVGDAAGDGVTARLLGAARANGIEHDLAAALVDMGSGGEASGSRLATLARIPLFAYCTERELLAIAGVTRPIRYRAGGVVFREGDPGSGMYLVVAGQLAVLKGEQEIARLGPGANFGEMSMLDQPTRSASVRAAEDSELLLITRDAFFGLLKRDPTLAVKVLWNMLLRVSANLRTTSEKLAAHTEQAAS